MADSAPAAIGMMLALGIGLLTGAERRPAPPQSQTADLQPAVEPGRTITRSPDGLFYVRSRLNGAPVLLALDTGANVTVLRAADARRAGLLHHKLTFDETILTGGGHVAIARTKLTHARIMDRDFPDLPIVVARGSFPVSVLGQDLLRRMGPLLIDADQMTLGPAKSAPPGAIITGATLLEPSRARRR